MTMPTLWQHQPTDSRGARLSKSGASCCALLLAWATAAASDVALRSVELAQLCVTNGEVIERPNGKLAVDTPSSRAIVPHSDGDTAELRFRYLGPSIDSKPLASGELRRQIGLKLRAMDSCNVLYVMWRFEPHAAVVVSLKRNPDAHTHAQCHTNGYMTLHAIQTAITRAPLPGAPHTLQAELRGSQLTVWADGARAWMGNVTGLDAIDGPVGLRTDNARIEFDYLTVIDATTPGGCERQPED